MTTIILTAESFRARGLASPCPVLGARVPLAFSDLTLRDLAAVCSFGFVRVRVARGCAPWREPSHAQTCVFSRESCGVLHDGFRLCRGLAVLPWDAWCGDSLLLWRSFFTAGALKGQKPLLSGRDLHFQSEFHCWVVLQKG